MRLNINYLNDTQSENTLRVSEYFLPDSSLRIIENNDLTGFLSHAFDEESCEVLPIEQQTIDLTKKCDWEK